MSKILGPQANVDIIFDGKAHGNLASLLLNGEMDVRALRTNDTLKYDEWKEIDRAVMDISRRRLVVVNDLISRGLVYRLTNALGSTVFQYQDASDMSAAEMSMAGEAMPTQDRVEFDTNYLPLPIVHKAFKLNARVLAASRSGGQALDTYQAQIAAKLVSEKIEEIFLTGASTYTFGGGVLYGFTDFTYANTGSLTAAWTASAADPVADIVAMKAASISDRHFGPWMVYIPTAYQTVLDEDYVSGYPKTIRQRILEIEGIAGIKTADFLTAGKVVMVELQPETVRAIHGMDPTVVEWETQGGMVLNYLVMAIIVPQLRADQANRSGIMVYSA
jgi:hypothetical protein